jgi:hypothetical protein
MTVSGGGDGGPIGAIGNSSRINAEVQGLDETGRNPSEIEYCHDRT